MRARCAMAALALSAAVALLALTATGCSSQPPAQVAEQKSATPQAENYLDDARVELEAKNFNAARAMVELAADQGAPADKVGALNAELERALSARALASKDRAKAYEHLKNAAAHEPSPARSFEDLLAAIELGQQSGVMAAELAPLASRAVEITTSAAKAQRLAAQLWDDAGEPARALPYYQWLHKVTPDDTTISSRLGTILYNEGKIDAARRIFEQIYRADPDQVIAALKLAEIYTKLTQYEQADKLYATLLQANPDSPGILIRYARFLKARGNYTQAAELEERAREAQPGIKRRKMRKLR